MKELSPLDAYKELIDELVEKHTEDSFRERLLLEVLPAAYLAIRFYDDYDILRQYALKKLEAQKKE